MPKPDGGPAFPREDYQVDCAPGQRGMSLRDYFAAKAMAACVGADSHVNQNYASQPSNVAELAYEFADAMLAERAK